MQSHLNFSSKLPNGWSIQTHFGKIEDGTFFEEKEDFAELEDIEILHLRIMQYFKDFQQFPDPGDFLIGDKDGCRVHEKWIDLKEKEIIFFLI